jgi:hypothetical protein
MPVIKAVSAAHRNISAEATLSEVVANLHPVHACDREGRFLP